MHETSTEFIGVDEPTEQETMRLSRTNVHAHLISALRSIRFNR